MDQTTTKALIAATKDFYTRTQSSFSATRQHAWPCWERIASVAYDGDSLPLRLLDLGCGNMRFEHFLARNFADRFSVSHNQIVVSDNFDASTFVNATMVDAVKFADAAFPGTFIERDIISEIATCGFDDKTIPDRQLIKNDTSQASTPVSCKWPLQDFAQSAFDLSVSFGVIHHVPGYTNRCSFINTMINATAPDGYVAISFWQPLNDSRIARKAAETTSRGLSVLSIDAASGNWFGSSNCQSGNMDSECDDRGVDMLLGWQDDESVFRYCHHFSNAEIEGYVNLAQVLGARTVDLFSPENGSDHLNTYLVLRSQ